MAYFDMIEQNTSGDHSKTCDEKRNRHLNHD